jgi:acyl carrier protein
VSAQGLVNLHEAGLLAAVLGIWREVLGCGNDQLAADSNFFLSGGDSLHLLRVLVRVRERLGVDLPLRDVARFSTPANMARCCAGALSRQPGVRPVTERQAQGGLRFACTSGLSALWLAEQCAESPGLYNTAVVLHFSGDLRVPVLVRALGLVLDRHEMLRATLHFDLRERQLYAAIGAGLPFTLEPVPMPPEAARRFLQAEAARPFDLAVGPLWRMRLVATGACSWSLLICLHHCVTDGWSGGVLLRHLGEAYNVLVECADAQAPECDREFRQFSVGAGALSQEALRFWRAKLDGADRLRSWPHTGTRRWPFVMACEEQVLDAHLLAPVHAVRHRAQVGLSACMLASLRLALGSLAGIDELCIGMPVSLRNTIAQENAVGYFVNFVILRERLAAGLDGIHAARQVQQSLSEAMYYRAAPLSELARRLQPRLLPSGNPWCDIVFAYQNLPREPPRFCGVHATVETLTLAGQYPLKVEFIPDGAACRCRIEYARGVVAPVEVRDLHSAIRHQLAALGAARNS